MDPLIVTLALDAGAFAFFDAQRWAFFPSERNLIPRASHALPRAAGGGGGRGRGVAYRLESPDLVGVRRGLATRAAKAPLARLEAGFTPFPVLGEGLLLRRYRGGPWEPAGRFDFAGSPG